MRILSAIDRLAWIAGFLEGEGCFWFRNSPGVSAAQKEREPLEWLQKQFGGGISKTGNVWTWQIHGAPALALMLAVHPLMSHRRQQRIREVIASSRSRKGVARGERHGRSRLTKGQVDFIRRSKYTGSTLAQRYGVSPSTISAIRRGVNWVGGAAT